MIDGLDSKIRWMAYLAFSIKSRKKEKQTKKKTLIAI